MTSTSAGEDAGRPIGSGYVLGDLIGAGSMGHVYRGQTRAGDPVAIKVLRSELTTDPAFVGRFLQEAQILTRISSANTVAVRDLVAEGSQIAIIMDLVDGPDLRTEISRRGTVPPGIALWLTDQILAGVGAIHDAGIVHRDIKPENVLLDTSAGSMQTRITDFGIARIVEEGTAGRTTAVIGTPDYIAPEVADGREPTPASDLYAVGIMLYEMLTGIAPFAGGSPLAVMRRHVEQQPGRPDGLPDALWQTITALLAKSPADRPASAAQARATLSAVAPLVSGMGALPRLTAPPLPVVDHQPTILTDHRVTTPLPQELVAEPHPEKRRRLPLLIGLLVALLLAGGGTAFAMLNGKDQAATAGSKPPATQSPSPSQSPSVSTSPTEPPTPSQSAPAAAAGVVPAVTGLLLDPAMTALQQAGLDVTIKEQLDDESPDSTVLAQNPPAGAPTPTDGKAEVTVARRSVGRYLADLEVVEESGPVNLRKEQVAVNGTAYVHAVWLSRGSYDCESGSVQYDLGRHYRQFVATAGLTDDSPSDSVVRMEVLTDGREAWTADLRLGKTQPIKVDVTGVLRLQLRVTTIKGECRNNAAYADAQLFGVASEVPAPVESNQ